MLSISLCHSISLFSLPALCTSTIPSTFFFVEPELAASASRAQTTVTNGGRASAAQSVVASPQAAAPWFSPRRVSDRIVVVHG